MAPWQYGALQQWDQEARTITGRAKIRVLDNTDGRAKGRRMA
ncbi:hypothetical protein ACH41H_37545 [Streptomyces sp. NPDC020800]